MLLIPEDRSIRGDGSDGLLASDPETRPSTISGSPGSTGSGFYHTAGGDSNDWGRELRPERMPIQMIPIDSIFSPVKKVNFTVENTRVGQSTDYEKLILEVWTNGTIRSEDTIAYAAKVLKDHLQVFINFEEEIEVKGPHVDEKRQKIITNLKRSVDELELSVRAYNCLKNENIKIIADLVQKTDQEMLKTRNFGRKSLNEIKEILTEMGLILGMSIDEYKEELNL